MALQCRMTMARVASCTIQTTRTPKIPRSNRLQFHHLQLQQKRALFYLPSILSPSLWRSMVPRFMRRSPTSTTTTPTSAIALQARKGYNPATYIIWMSLLIGSQAIQTITLRTSHDKFTRETDAKLSLLRDVVRRMRRGEDVNVAKELGTGQPAKEREWADGKLDWFCPCRPGGTFRSSSMKRPEGVSANMSNITVIRELEAEDAVFSGRRKARKAKAAASNNTEQGSVSADEQSKEAA